MAAVAGMPAVGIEPELPWLRVILPQPVTRGPFVVTSDAMACATAGGIVVIGQVGTVGIGRRGFGLGDRPWTIHRLEALFVDVKPVVRETDRFGHRLCGRRRPIL